LRVNHYPAIRIFSKADLIAENKRELLRRQYPQYHFTSSITGEGIRGLLDIIEERLIGSWPKNEIRLRAKDGHLVSKIYRLGKVLNFDQDKNGDYRILWQAPKSQLAKIKGIINR
ncbi:MAG: hypothetical protein HY747_09510, partial [Elusimicrobia bacterium]|nr:hypothetical protein [Elusimicrobiota bacterium]